MDRDADAGKIGLVGGLGWPSTIDYYRAICEGAGRIAAARGAEPPYPTPPIAIESLDMVAVMAARGEPGAETGWHRFDAALHGALARLEAAGCAVTLIATVTPHLRLEAAARGLARPPLSVLDTTAAAVAGTGARWALVLGTSLTMAVPLFAPAFAARGVEAAPLLPAAAVQALQRLIDTAFCTGAGEAGRAGLLAFCVAHVEASDDTVVVLGCTELPAAFPEHAGRAAFAADGFRFVNAAHAHAEAALAESRAAAAPVPA